MNGVIKEYKSDKGYGFIKGENNQDYFFHISNVKSPEKISIGADVFFQSHYNHKGGYAKEVEILINHTVKKIIKLGSTRNRLSNIKNYGISSERRYYQKVYHSTPNRDNLWNRLIMRTNHRYEGMEKDITYYYMTYSGDKELIGKLLYVKKGDPYLSENKEQTIAEEDGVYRSAYPIFENDDIRAHNLRYLYVTTFQNDNYTFYENEIDIDQKLEKLDNFFSI